jgi:hypothetical protein
LDTPWPGTRAAATTAGHGWLTCRKKSGRVAYATTAKAYAVKDIVSSVRRPFQIPGFEAVEVSPEVLDGYVGVYSSAEAPVRAAGRRARTASLRTVLHRILLSAVGRSYPAILHGNRVTWTGAAPQQQGPVPVNVTIVDPAPTAPPGPNGDADRGQRMADALSELAQSRSFEQVTDPSAWQREVRTDRSLPGRNEPPPDAPGQ